jgi:hypothetical protein
MGMCDDRSSTKTKEGHMSEFKISLSMEDYLIPRLLNAWGNLPTGEMELHNGFVMEFIPTWVAKNFPGLPYGARCDLIITMRDYFR